MSSWWGASKPSWPDASGFTCGRGGKARTGTIAIVATLDTKGIEIAFLKERIEALGCATLVLDIGVFEPAGLTPDLSRHEIAVAAGSSAESVALDTNPRRINLGLFRSALA